MDTQLLTYAENIPLENLAALALILPLALLGKFKALPSIIVIFYIAYMSTDFAFYGPGPKWPELSQSMEAAFNLVCLFLGLIVITLCAIAVQSHVDDIAQYKVPLTNGKKAVFRWSQAIVIACYGGAVFLLWVVPYALQLLTVSYTWPIHAAMMDNMVYIDIGLAWLAQLGKPYRDYLPDTYK